MTQPSDLLARIEALEAQLADLKSGLAPATAASDVGSPQTPACASAEPSASRRDLLRYGAAALGTAAVAALNTAPAEAADGGALLIGNVNTGTTITRLNSTGTYCFYAQTSAASYSGIAGEGPVFGTYGYCTAAGAVSVYGFAPSATGSTEGVRGETWSPDGAGVRGINHRGGNGVRAEVPTYSTVNGIAMYALNYSSYGGASPGAGGFAIYGLSARGHGLVGATAAAGAAAVVGATNGVAGAYAAAFYGPVIVGGNFTVVGGAKSAAVPHPDGSHRRLYCVESPESWFEDFGDGALVCGKAQIRLDPDFAAVVDTAAYHVFLTGHHGRCDLSVGKRTAEGFEVNGTESTDGTFSWRVVAKRKDIAGPRFEKVEIPEEPKQPDVPASVFEAPVRPAPPSAMAGGQRAGRVTR